MSVSTVSTVNETSKRNQPIKEESSMRKLYIIFTPRERIKVLILFVASLMSAMAQAFGVAVIFPFINVVMNPESIQQNRWLKALYQWRNMENANDFIIFLGISVFAVVVFSSLISAATIWAKNHFVLMKNHSLSYRLLTEYLSKPYNYFLLRNTNELGKNILEEVNQMTSAYLMAMFGILIHGSMLVVILVMLLLVNAKITIGTAMFLGGTYGLLNVVIRKNMKGRGNARLIANEQRYRLASEALSSIKTTKVMGNEMYFVERYGSHSKEFAKHNIFARVSSDVPRYFFEAIAFGGIVLFITISAVQGEDINNLIPLVSLFAFAGYRMMPALHNLYKDVVQLNFHQAIVDKIFQDMIKDKSDEDTVLSEEGQIKQDPRIEKLAFNDKIRLNDIRFRYNDQSPQVIDSLNIQINKNTSVGIVGHTGSGKTTLVDIILGLLVPNDGQIMIDKVEITHENKRIWQQMIGYVPQDIYLSDDTLRNNIAFGVPDNEVDDRQVKMAAKIAALDDFVQNELPELYETKIGERGVRLSGGQRQRIGLARALYRNPEVLILDEATSSLDGGTEEVVLDAIKNASQARTMIMIAHRLNTLKGCDQIYLIENGKVLSSGTYDELIHNDEKFMRMAKVLHEDSTEEQNGESLNS